MKKIFILISIIFVSFGLNAQTLATDTFQDDALPDVGASFNVPVNVSGIGEVLTLTVFLEFDGAVLNFTGYSDGQAGLNIANVLEYAPGLIKIEVGNFPNSSDVQDGLLLNLNFTFIGGQSDLTFGTSDYPTQGYKSSILTTSYTTQFFGDEDVTNGAVEGDVVLNKATTSGNWSDPTIWDLGVVPNSWHKATIKNNKDVVVDADANAYKLVVSPKAKVTVNATLNVTTDVLVKSTSSGDGSIIYKDGTLNVGGTATVQRYVEAATTNGWHGISAPVSGADFQGTYFGGNPNVYIKTYDEATDSYQNIIDTLTPMGDMVGYFAWVWGSEGQSLEFEGSFRTGTVGADNNLVRNGYGFNFVGNPFPSSIDWDAASGWTKSNVDDATYMYSGGNWVTYIGGVGTNGGTNEIAMGQGFFVKVSDGNTSGTLKMDDNVCIHSTSNFVKDATADQKIVRLALTNGQSTDETVIRFKDEATNGFDSNLDAVKLFSFDADFPQIYSVVGEEEMSINSLPYSDALTIPLNVKGKDGDVMTISLTESDDIPYISLIDHYTGTVTDINSSDYTFINTTELSNSNRFDLFFGVTGVDNNISTNDVQIYSFDNNVRVINDDNRNLNISIYNLLGQVVNTVRSNDNVTNITLPETGFYLVKVDDGVNVTTKKILIK